MVRKAHTIKRSGLLILLVKKASNVYLCIAEISFTQDVAVDVKQFLFAATTSTVPTSRQTLRIKLGNRICDSRSWRTAAFVDNIYWNELDIT